ncbi:hypothetical protein M1403_03915 [Patescibacteria group bacterium]|nr:hypothetical protein [Patescibacteria group bacterium]
MERLFNPKPGTILHLDLNSCFASIEQQANPFLRGKPIVVAAYDSPGGCIVAPSREAKILGIKVGMRVKEARLIYPKLIVKTPDPNKYRAVHLQLKTLLSEYTDDFSPKSIDEFVLNLEGAPVTRTKNVTEVALEIKRRIKAEIGDFLTVSMGIAPNRYLAKVAAGLHKPDGLDEINETSYREIYSKLALMDLTGIKKNNAVRLNSGGIFTVMDFYNADMIKLKNIFGGIFGWYWHLRLHGFEIDDVVFGRRSYGNSFSLPKPYSTPEELVPILVKLVEKTGFRMRRAGYFARGVHVSLLYRDWSYWHHGEKTQELLFDGRDIYRHAFGILLHCPYRKPVHTLAVSCFNLENSGNRQLSLLQDLDKKEKVVEAMDEINEKWGNFVITPAMMLGTKSLVPDRIAFGGIKELEELYA